MVDVVGAGVLVGIGASVVGLAVVPAALHAAGADAAEQQTAQDIRVGAGAGSAVDLTGILRGEELLGLAEDLVVDDRRVDDLLGEDPLVLVVPAHDGGVAEGDVVHVEQDLVFALAVPHLAAGVARVAQDGADGALGPGQPAAVLVAGPVMGGRARDAIGCQPLRYREDPETGEELGEDPHDHDRGGLVAGQDVQALAVGGLGRVRVRPGVNQLVSVRRAAAEEAALDLGLGGHGGADPDLDAVPFPFGQAAEGGHDHVVGLVGRVDGAADLGHPQRHSVVLEQREGVAELVAVERPLRLTDDHGVEAAVGVGERGQELAGLGAALRWY